jgi:indole-3-glycerol phosphate synthase
MSNILKQICDKKKIEIEYTKKKYSLQSLKKLLPKKDNRNFKDILESSKKNKINSVIAEIKKRSPSAGMIIEDYSPEKIAVEYEKSGAAAISILTESSFFSGHIDHLSLINKKVNLPILRKDFILDPYQIYESKVFKADSILLIASILSDELIKEFIKISEDIGIDCILEVHTHEEIQRAIKIDYQIIGINNRNLDTLSVNTNNTINLLNDMAKDYTIVAESGINSHLDILKYNKEGIYNFLIGESILRSKNIEYKFQQLLNK